MWRKVLEYIEGETLVGAVMEGVIVSSHEYYEKVFTSKGRRPRNPEVPSDGKMFCRWAEGVFDVGDGFLAFGDDDGDDGGEE